MLTVQRVAAILRRRGFRAAKLPPYARGVMSVSPGFRISATATPGRLSVRWVDRPVVDHAQGLERLRAALCDAGLAVQDSPMSLYVSENQEI